MTTKTFGKAFIFCFIAFIIAGFVAIYFHSKLGSVNNTKIVELRDSIEMIRSHYDSIIKIKQQELDGLKINKEKILVVYETAEKDFSDSNIINDDSIIMYIAKKIQN